jgi:hypothetical protein
MSVTLDLPGPGVVIVNSGGSTRFDANPSSARCSITKGMDTTTDPVFFAQNHNTANARRMPIGSTNGFVEAAAGPQTYNLVCMSNVGDANIEDGMLTAIFTPNQY